MERKRRHSSVSAIRLPTVDPEATPQTIMTAYSAWIAQLYADLAESLDGVALQGALPVEIGTNLHGVALSPQISRSAGILRGWSLRETGGQAVTLDFFDVDEAQGQNIVVAGSFRRVATTQLAANGASTAELPNASFQSGLGVLIGGAGTVTGVLYLNGVD